MNPIRVTTKPLRQQRRQTKVWRFLVQGPSGKLVFRVGPAAKKAARGSAPAPLPASIPSRVGRKTAPRRGQELPRAADCLRRMRSEANPILDRASPGTGRPQGREADEDGRPNPIQPKSYPFSNSIPPAFPQTMCNTTTLYSPLERILAAHIPPAKQMCANHPPHTPLRRGIS